MNLQIITTVGCLWCEKPIPFTRETSGCLLCSEKCPKKINNYVTRTLGEKHCSYDMRDVVP